MIRQVSHGPRGGHALLAGLKRPATSPATFNSAVDLETLTRIPEFTPTPQSDCAQIVPNFVSKHVRQHCVAIARNRMKVRLQKLPRPPREPSAVPSFAAVMMADVSGYSTLTSILAERGSTGVDLLGKTMKGYLDRIIATILTHDGDIVKFAGDAVIVYWKLQSHEAETEINRGELVLKAAFCCMDLLNSLGTYDINVPNCSTKVLRLHLGIGAGQIYDVHVGGSPGRWEHFIAGDALRQLSQVLDLAKAGELAMSHAALKWFSSVVDIETIRVAGYDKRCVLIHGLEKARRKIPRSNQAPSSGPAELELSLFSDILHSYINESALFKLQADINQSNLFRLPSDLPNLLKLQEIRQITTVFIKLDTIISKWESGDALKIAQSTMQCVQEALIKYEGSLRQFHVDDKGAVMLAFFGLPPLAHLNDASHGIKAVLEIRHRLMDLLDEFSIGVTTGVVSIGGVGINDRTEYAVMGDSINMAARLMCHPEARNAMLCDEKTYILCKNEFEFEKLGETKVKGKANPIRIFRPLSARLEAIHDEAARAQISKEIIGRAREKDLIFSVLHSFDKEEVGVAVLEADGGQGLSTLFGFTKEEALGGGCLTWYVLAVIFQLPYE
ncbi:nucleotide cyclase [Zopfochytrium polystomum]|nr:nucleotide cyclase [Zopfochytrium polystomum]